MRIECANCAAKYSVSDEKVVGRVFKVRCKKCSEMITVDGTAMTAGEETDEATRVFDPNAGEGVDAGSSEAIWYAVIDGSQTGPLTSEEVSAQIAAGAVDIETFAWRDGMDDWIRMGDIPDLAALFPSSAAPAAGFEDESTRVATAPEADIFAGVSESPAAAAPEPAAPAPAPFSSSVPRASSSDFFRSTAPSSVGGGLAASANEPKSVGQRNESSVLFSLADLAGGSKSASKDAATPRTEGSGLIDIRVLASAAGGTQLNPAVTAPSGGGSTTTMAAIPVAPMIPIPAKKSNTGLVALLAVAAIVIIGLLAAIVFFVTREPVAPAPVAVAVAPTPAPAAAAPTEGTAPAAPPAAPPVAAVVPAAGSGATAGTGAAADGTGAGEGTAAPVAVAAATPAPSAPAEARPAGDSATRAAASAAPRPAAEPARAVEQSAPTPTPTPSTPTPPARERGGDDAVANALDAIRGGQGGSTTRTETAPPPAAEPAAAAPTGLSRSDVQATIRRYNSRIGGCETPEAEGQSYTIAFVIQPSGSVTNVSPADSNDVSQCLAGVVRDMAFPRFEGDPLPVRYPFRF